MLSLDVEHIVYQSSQEFYRQRFRFLLQNQEERRAVHTVSYIYAPLCEGNALQLAVEKRIPLDPGWLFARVAQPYAYGICGLCGAGH